MNRKSLKILCSTVIILCGLVMPYFVNAAGDTSSEAGSFWTIRVNPGIRDSSPSVFGLWEPSGGSATDLFFGIFDERALMERALAEIQRLDATAKPERLEKDLRPKFIPVKRHITLPELGYRTSIHIRGVQGWTSIHIPWTKTAILKGAKAVLYVRFPSGVFAKPSTLTVSVENVPIKVLHLDDSMPSPLVIPLDAIGNVEVGDFLDISLSTSIAITGDVCVDQRLDNAWVIVEPTSFFEISYVPVLKDLADAFRNPTNRFNVLISEKPASEEVSGLVNLASLIGSLHPYNRDRLIIPGSAYSLTHPNIMMKPGDEEVRVVGRDIIASPEGLVKLAKMFDQVMPPLSQVKSSTIKNGEKPQGEFFLKFSDLGIIPPRLQGVGDLQFSVPFSVAALGGFPSRLITTLIYSHSPIHKDERAFLKVRLNGVLVASNFITGAGKNETFSFELPSRLIQTNNTLEVGFSYYTYRGECRGSFPELEVSVSDDSFFSITGRSSSEPDRFYRFPGFLDGDGTMVVSEFSPAFIDLAMGLSEKIGKIRRSSLSVKVLNFEQFSSAPQSGSFVIGVVKASQSGLFKPPVDLSQEFLIKNPQTERELLRVTTDDNVAVWQVFKSSGHGLVGLLALSEALIKPELIRALLSGLNIEGNANVAVWAANRYSLFYGEPPEPSWQVFEIGDKLRVIAPAKKGFLYYWERYRIVFFIFLGVAVFLFLWYVYRKLT